MPALRTSLFLILVVALSGCDREIVQPLPIDIEAVGLDLSEVRTEPVLQLALRAGTSGSVTRMEVNGVAAAFDGPAGVFRDTLTLDEGLNAIRVQAFEGTRVATVDTLWAVYLPIVRQGFLVAPVARIFAAGSALPDGRALVSGGAAPGSPALATFDVLSESGSGLSIASAPLLVGRVGHASVVLPDGAVLLLGGASVPQPGSGADFLTSAELINTSDLSTQLVSIEGASLSRIGHSARALQTGGRTIIYVFGGQQPFQAGTSPSGTVTILEYFGGVQPRLQALTPVGGAGSFTSTIDHVQLDVPARPGTVGTSIIVDDRTSFAFDWSTPGRNYPFDLIGSRLSLGDDARRSAAAGVVLPNGLGVIVGGKTASGSAVGGLNVYADEPRRAFTVPSQFDLTAPRFAHVATNLGSGRMVVLGGLSTSGTPLTPIEIYRF